MMTFEIVSERNMDVAAEIHAATWRDSHKHFCSEPFVAAHTAARQKQYMEQEINRGRVFYLVMDPDAKGLVSVCGTLIENLYVLPSEQRKGYGTALLRYAERYCIGMPKLWVLSNNEPAKHFYLKAGYAFTGKKNDLNPNLSELEMIRIS